MSKISLNIRKSAVILTRGPWGPGGPREPGSPIDPWG